MKQILLLFTLGFVLQATADIINVQTGVYQKEMNQTTTIIDYTDDGICIKFTNTDINVIQRASTEDLLLSIYGFQNGMATNKPSIPQRSELFQIPEGFDINLSLIDAQYYDYHIPLTGAIEPTKESTNSFNHTEITPYNGFYPKSMIEIGTIKKKGIFQLIPVIISPVQYNYLDKTARIYTNLQFKVTYTAKVTDHSFISGVDNISDLYDEDLLKAGIYPLIKNEKRDNVTSDVSTLTKSVNNAVEQIVPDYLIITKADYLSAANKLANWKRIQGFKVTVRSRTSWTTTQIQNIINLIYNKPLSKKYCLLLGSINDIPSNIISTSLNGEEIQLHSDLPYFTLSGDDNIPEFNYGRIPVQSESEAMTVVDKIIKYESAPPLSSHFYTTGINIAVFQDSLNENMEEVTDSDGSDGYEDFRHCETVNEIYEYLKTKGIYGERLYYYPGWSEPTHWSKWFSYGQPLPSDLRNYNTNDIWFNDNLDGSLINGAWYVLYRGHANNYSWADTCHGVSNFANVQNSDKLPFIFNIACQTGLNGGETWAHSILTNTNGGGIGMIGASSNSLTCFNDALTHGIFNAFFPSPGIISDMTYTADSKDTHEVICQTYYPEASSPINEIFEALQQGFYRSEKVYPISDFENNYQRKIYHLFADPSMCIYTKNPYRSAQPTYVITRTETGVSVTVSNFSGVVSFYNTKNGDIKRYVGTSTFFYPTDTPEKVCVSLKEANRPVYVNLGNSSNLNFD